MQEREKIISFLKEKIPLVIDLDKQDIKYDKSNIYYKILKYIRELEKNIKGDENKWLNYLVAL